MLWELIKAISEGMELIASGLHALFYAVLVFMFIYHVF
jgi:hypothetical protein